MRKTKRTAIALLLAVAMLFTLFLASCTKPVDAAKTMIEQITNPDSQTAYTVEATNTYLSRSPEDPSITKQQKQDCLVLIKGKEVHAKYVTDNGEPEYQGIVSAGTKYYGYSYKGEDASNAEYFEISNDSIDDRVWELCPIVPILPVLKQLFPDGFEEKDGVYVLKEESYLDFYRIGSGDTEATEIPEEYKAEIIKGAESLSLEVEKDSFTIHNSMTMREGAYGTMVAKVSNVGTTDFKPFHALTLPSNPETPSNPQSASEIIASLLGENANFTCTVDARISSNGAGKEYMRVSGNRYHSKSVIGESEYYQGIFTEEGVAYEYYGDNASDIRLQNTWDPEPDSRSALFVMFVQPALENFHRFYAAADGEFRLKEEEYLAMYNIFSRGNYQTLPPEGAQLMQTYRIAIGGNGVEVSFRADPYYGNFKITDIGATVFEPYVALPEQAERVPHPSDILKAFASGTVDYALEDFSAILGDKLVSGAVSGNRAYFYLRNQNESIEPRTQGLYRDGDFYYTYDSASAAPFTAVTEAQYNALLAQYDFRKMLNALTEGFRQGVVVLTRGDELKLKQGAEADFYRLLCGDTEPDPTIDPSELFKDFVVRVSQQEISIESSSYRMKFWKIIAQQFNPPFAPSTGGDTV